MCGLIMCLDRVCNLWLVFTSHHPVCVVCHRSSVHRSGSRPRVSSRSLFLLDCHPGTKHATAVDQAPPAPVRALTLLPHRCSPPPHALTHRWHVLSGNPREATPYVGKEPGLPAPCGHHRDSPQARIPPTTNRDPTIAYPASRLGPCTCSPQNETPTQAWPTACSRAEHVLPSTSTATVVHAVDSRRSPWAQSRRGIQPSDKTLIVSLVSSSAVPCVHRNTTFCFGSVGLVVGCAV